MGNGDSESKVDFNLKTILEVRKNLTTSMDIQI